MADQVEWQPGNPHLKPVSGEEIGAATLKAANSASSPEQTFLVLPSEHATEIGKILTDAPGGTVTLLFTDIEGSTQLLRQSGGRYSDILTQYRNLLRAAFRQWNGYEVSTQGDAFFAVFARATDAVAAAVTVQRGKAAYPWPEGTEVRIRMGLHTGEPIRSSEGYIGLDVHLAAQLMSAAHGGQVILSKATKELAQPDLPEGVDLRDLGFYHLKDFPQPRHIFQLVIADLSANFPPLRDSMKQFNNLPAQFTSLIGREQEVAAISTLLQREDVRLLTLTGPGGIGKTRLSLAAASELLDVFADGVCFVPLAPISDPALVILTIAHLLGLEHTHTGSWSAQVDMEYLKAFLQEKHFLLLLDNFEQVVLAAPDLTELLIICPHLHILVTSRAALHLQEEREFPVSPLAFPKRIRFPVSEDLMQYAAITLFLQRALTVQPDLAITKANIHAVATICKHLDGLPLAIELAAARSKVLPPQALLQRLTHRLAVLTGGAQNVSARQQTLRNTIAWSYNLLDAAEQRLFRRLSVFVGGCTLEAIEATCSTVADGGSSVLDGVSSLIDKSLLQQIEQEEDEPRFAMLETIREYGLECLAASGELEQTRQAHAAHYLQLAEEAEPHLYGAEQVEWFNRLEREHDNLRVVMYWSVEKVEAKEAGQRNSTALRLAGVLVRFWVVRGYVSEGQTWLAQALANSEGINPAVRANALSWAGWLVFLQSDVERAEVLCEQALICYREARKTQKISALASSLIGLSWLALRRGNDSVVRFLLDESRLLARETGDRRGLAYLLHFLAGATIHEGKYAEARSMQEESLALFKEMDNKFEMAWSYRFLGLILFALHDKVPMYALVEESLALSRAMHEAPGLACSLFLLGRIALIEGNPATALPLLEESLTVLRAIGERHPIAHVLSQLANIATIQGNRAAADAYHKESLGIFRQIDDMAGLALCLQEWGAKVAQQGEARWAARLWGVAETLHGVRNLLTPFLLFVEHTDYEQTEYERMVSNVRTQLGEQAFAAAWAEGRAMTPEQVLAKQGREITSEPAIVAPQASLESGPKQTYPAGLTARELGVLRLVAKGLTNFEIAEELGLSEKTISHHLTHIFNKTNSENRAAATAFAIRHGLA